MSSNIDVELNARYLVLADVRFHTNQEIYERCRQGNSHSDDQKTQKTC